MGSNFFLENEVRIELSDGLFIQFYKGKIDKDYQPYYGVKFSDKDEEVLLNWIEEIKIRRRLKAEKEIEE